jgi:hypothetical protein
MNCLLNHLALSVMAYNLLAAKSEVRELRVRITQSLRKKGIDCDRVAVIDHGHRGYHLSKCICVQWGENVDDSSRKDMNSATHVRKSHVRKGPDVRNQADRERQEWILGQLELGRKLRAPDIHLHFGCALTTSHRDLQVLAKQRRIEFVGAKSVGHCRRVPDAGSSSG